MVDFPSVVIALDRESQSMTRLAREMSAASSLTPENTLLDRGCVHAAPGCTSLLLSTEVEVVLSQRCVYIYVCVCLCACTTRVHCTSPVPRIRNFTYIGPDATLPLLLSPPILLSIIIHIPPPLFLPTSN